MEEIDRRIVSLLSRNGRMSFTELARQAGLSVSAVHQRVRRLETEGVITGYVALCDAEVIGLPLTAFVSIKPFDPSAPDDVPDRLSSLSALAPHGLVLAGFVGFFVLLLMPVVFALGMPLLRRARFGTAEVNRVVR